MPSRARMLLQRLEKKARRGHQGGPVGTVAFYGPDDRTATKVVASIVLIDEVEEMEKWFATSGDVRDDDDVMRAVVDFLELGGARTLVVTPGVFGCPHEEGIDYPEGEVCPHCPSWAGRDRHAIL